MASTPLSNCGSSPEHHCRSEVGGTLPDQLYRTAGARSWHPRRRSKNLIRCSRASYRPGSGKKKKCRCVFHCISMNISMTSMLFVGVGSITRHCHSTKTWSLKRPLLSPLKGSNPRKGRRPSSWENQRVANSVCVTVLSKLKLDSKEIKITSRNIYIYKLKLAHHVSALAIHPVYVWQFGLAWTQMATTVLVLSNLLVFFQVSSHRYFLDSRYIYTI